MILPDDVEELKPSALDPPLACLELSLLDPQVAREYGLARMENGAWVVGTSVDSPATRRQED